MPAALKISASAPGKTEAASPSVGAAPSEGISQVVKDEPSASAHRSSEVNLPDGQARVSSFPDDAGGVFLCNTVPSELIEKVRQSVRRTRPKGGNKRKPVSELIPILKARVPKLMRASEDSERVAHYLGVVRFGVLDLTIIDLCKEVERLKADVYRKPAGRAMGAGAGKAGVA